MRFIPRVFIVAFTTGLLALLMAGSNHYPFNGSADNPTDEDGYYYALTGGKFPTGDIPNGDNASGGTFRFILDDSSWGGYPLNVWNKDDWFPENAGLALTLMKGNSIRYDNNGIIDGSHGGFYDYTDVPETSDWTRHVPGLYRGYVMPNNWDWIYATYFRIVEETEFDTIIGFFDETSGFDRNAANVDYRFQIWSSVQTGPNTYMPAVASFSGDVFDSDNIEGIFEVKYSGIDRVFPSWYDFKDPIYQNSFKLKKHFTLQPGVYFFSHQAVLVTPVKLTIERSRMPNFNANVYVQGTVYGSADFDAAAIDTGTVFLHGARAESATVDDVDSDGYDDIVMVFRRNEIMLKDNENPAVMRGFTFNLEPFKGTADMP